MLVTFKTLGLPITAADKFNEAVYFYNRMLAERRNVRTFPYNLSAFLSALRSVTFYLQKQFADHIGFAEWYDKKREQMRKDTGLCRIKQMRDEALHAEPNDIWIVAGPRFENGISTTHFEFSLRTDNDGTLRIPYKISADGPEIDVEPRVYWIIDPPEREPGPIPENEEACMGTDLLGLCAYCLEQVRAVLDEWKPLYQAQSQTNGNTQGTTA